MAINEIFVAKLEVLYQKKKELVALEKARNEAYSAAGQQIATKQAEVTLAEQDVAKSV